MLNKLLGTTVTVYVDRALGSRHPKFTDMIYPVNYGYIKDMIGGDGEEQDAYILGVDYPLEEFTGCVIAVIHRLDDVEDKLVVAPIGVTFDEAQIREATFFQERYFNSSIACRGGTD